MRKYKKVKRKEIIFNLDEWKAIEEKAELLSMKTGTFIKRMSLEGKITCYAAKNVAPIMNALRIIGNNINQIAKKANETNNIYAEDIEKIRKENLLLCLISPKTHTYKTNINHISPCKKIKVLQNSCNTLIDILFYGYPICTVHKELRSYENYIVHTAA